jgi:hypothetical protein
MRFDNYKLLCSKKVVSYRRTKQGLGDQRLAGGDGGRHRRQQRRLKRILIIVGASRNPPSTAALALSVD